MKNILSLLCAVTIVGSVNNAQALVTEKSAEMAIESIKETFAEHGVDGNLRVVINGFEDGFDLKNKPEAYKIYVNDINFNNRTRFWKADLSFTTKDNQHEEFTVSGSFDRLISVPVLNISMPRNSVINESDFRIMEMPASKLKFDTVTDTDDLIGKSLRRTIANSMPLKARDLQKIQIVSRNGAVNIVYNTRTISLRDIGIAMESGGKGDIIKVKNSSSGKVIQAVILDEQNVEIPGVDSNTQSQTASIEDYNYAR